MTTRDALAVIGAIALVRLAYVTLRARFVPLLRPPMGLIPDPRPLPPAGNRERPGEPPSFGGGR